ncbi:histone H1A, sperm-like [Acyrthosiphon pisum]|uniref:H15 domain-containing protein n=1 Tax=Acyrthosiphon pisum TaxID=7029 RepID=A0A8R1W0X6_ACYPI|nr:histone H1A, sperm-like [Acyrthosiphon pisum]|eukprot:XP_001944288.1 PREDICTED: histone H1A, sperm-like [Acyrthosiphon pisum]
MASTETVQTAAVAPVAASPIKKKTPTTTKANVSAHPSTAVMVIAAITELKEKKGSSLSAIKKYMSNNYKVDSAKLAPFIRKFLKAAVVKGTLLQTNGTGAMGHFKLPVVVKKKEPAVSKKPSSAATKKKAKPAKVSAAGTPKKRKLPAKKAPTAAEPSAKKPKAVAAKPKKSLVKAKKAVAAPKPPKVKKATAVKRTKSSPRK